MQTKFRIEWLKQEVFRNWLVEVKESNSVAHCKLCKCDINAKYSDLNPSSMIMNPPQVGNYINIVK